MPDLNKLRKQAETNRTRGKKPRAEKKEIEGQTSIFDLIK